MAQNLMLDFNGMTPQQALTGQQKDLYNFESNTLDAYTGALAEKPDILESMMRFRLLAKQAILQGIVEDRFTQASRIRQHSHSQELLMPGTIVDVWKTTNRYKDEHGWKGPAEILSIERRAGSAIVKHQGVPFIVPLHYLRKHVLTQFFTSMLLSAPSQFEGQLSNPQLACEVYSTLHRENILPSTEHQHFLDKHDHGYC